MQEGERKSISSNEPEFKNKHYFFLVNRRHLRSTENNSIWEIKIKNHVKIKKMFDKQQ